MKNRNYLIGILVLLIILGILFTSGIYYYAIRYNKTIEYRDLATIFTAFIVSGSFIISTLNTKLSADLNQAKLDFDIKKFENDKKIGAFNLFKEYNSDAMVAHNVKAVTFMKVNSSMDPAALIVKLNADIDSSKSVTMLLNHLELIALSYKVNIADRILIKELFLDIFRIQYGQFDLYIKTKQKQYSSNYFDTFEEVAKEWNSK